ncbi:flagellar hook-associated protein 2 [Paenibacillus sp. UNCCL117]|uniref:flagellar filament capping protein FliD n=1 Tax=unclassified Paenibacillus TaxID=185978 RepID=UPI0008917E51|nr:MULTISPECIES: flagellar filament capping protein FliD [unclassified Paenibacillus]SDE50338.1 flagellar hook-associated protein 2 [Paenibacillus sp. cl123]SFW67383.1 flagellar hook-associated protein 2 [Paenibacillus sp. UNCCL117]
MPVMRINGFSSGMDIDEMVKKLMQAHRVPSEKLVQKKAQLEWQRDDYRALNTKMMDFRNTAFNMKLQSSYTAKKATSSNEGVVTASGTSGGTDGTYTLRIKQLAETASLTSGDVVTSGPGDSKASLESIGLTLDTSMYISGEKGSSVIKLSKTDTVTDVVNSINSRSSQTGVKASYDANLDRFFFSSTNTGDDANVTLRLLNEGSASNLLSTVFKLPTAPAVPGASLKMDAAKTIEAGGTATFDSLSQIVNKSMTGVQKLKVKYGSEEIELNFTNKTTVGQVIDTINGSKLGKAGLTASLDPTTKKLAFFNPDSGKDLNFENVDSGTVDANLGLNSLSSQPNMDYSEISVSGKSAIVDYNDVENAKFASNTFSINGIQFTARKIQAASEDPVKITVNQDIDAVFNSIKTFIDKYNDTIATISKKISEQKYRSFTPLTDEQKKEMKENDIKLWEEKAKSGMLRRDPIFTSALSGFRSAFNNTVSGIPSGDINELSLIGIKTGAYFEEGKLNIDEQKLREAITNNPEQVMALFTRNDNDPDSQAGDGLAVRLYDQVSAVMKQVSEKAGSTSDVTSVETILGKQLRDVETRITRYTSKLGALEERYYKQFTAMEKALQQMNTQSSWLSQQLGG